MLKITTRLICAPLLLACSSNSFSSETLKNIEPLEWQNRIMLVRERSNCKNTINHLKQAKADIDERHIFWFLLCNRNQLISNYMGVISSQFSHSVNKIYFPNRNNSVVLIGKDGGIKYRSPQLDLNEINNRIDSMPMRQAEMRKEQN